MTEAAGFLATVTLILVAAICAWAAMTWVAENWLDTRHDR